MKANCAEGMQNLTPMTTTTTTARKKTIKAGTVFSLKMLTFGKKQIINMNFKHQRNVLTSYCHIP